MITISPSIGPPMNFSVEPSQVSDGYHTIEELYEHRIRLWITLCKVQKDLNYTDTSAWRDVWRAPLHSDGSMYPGWFVLGMGIHEGEQITYHLPEKYWDECNFADVLERAPKWDGHGSSDVLERLKSLDNL